MFTGMLALLLDTELSSTQRDYAQTAQACGRALIALINEVLDRAKIEAGKLDLESVPFDIRSILDDVLSLFSEKSRHKGIEVKVKPDYLVICYRFFQIIVCFNLIMLSLSVIGKSKRWQFLFPIKSHKLSSEIREDSDKSSRISSETLLSSQKKDIYSFKFITPIIPKL